MTFIAAFTAHLRTCLSLPLSIFLALIPCMICLAAYRLRLGPLVQFPGSKWAALTGWYEFYHQVVKDGRYVWKIQEMHDEHGDASPSSRLKRGLSWARSYHTNQSLGATRQRPRLLRRVIQFQTP